MKLRVIKAKSRRKAGEYLQKKLNRGESDEFTLLDEEVNLLHDLHSGNLRREQNEAVIAFGHGKLVNDRGEELHIGGSTGGQTRRLMGTFIEPDLEAFGVGSNSLLALN